MLGASLKPRAAPSFTSIFCGGKQPAAFRLKILKTKLEDGLNIKSSVGTRLKQVNFDPRVVFMRQGQARAIMKLENDNDMFPDARSVSENVFLPVQSSWSRKELRIPNLP